MGPKRKKGPFKKVSEKHLRDKLKQEFRELNVRVGWATYSTFANFTLDYHLPGIERGCDKLDALIQELVQRME